MRLPRRLLVRKRLLRHLLILLVLSLLVLLLPVLPSRLRLTARNVVSSARAVSSRFAAVACSSTRRAAPLLPPVHRVLRHSPGLHRRLRLRRRRLLFHSISPFSLHSPFSLLRFSRPPLRHLHSR